MHAREHRRAQDTSKAGRLVSIVISENRTTGKEKGRKSCVKVGHELLNRVRRLLQFE